MSTPAPAVLPALDKFNLVGDFISTVIYGTFYIVGSLVMTGKLIWIGIDRYQVSVK